MGDAKSNETSQITEDAAFPLTAIDRWVLSQTDEEFHLHDWNELKDIIGRSAQRHTRFSTFKAGSQIRRRANSFSIIYASYVSSNTFQIQITCQSSSANQVTSADTYHGHRR